MEMEARSVYWEGQGGACNELHALHVRSFFALLSSSYATLHMVHLSVKHRCMYVFHKRSDIMVLTVLMSFTSTQKDVRVVAKVKSYLLTTGDTFTLCL